MSLTKESSIEHVNYEEEDLGIECEYVYDEESNAKSTKDSIKDLCPENKKPTHKKTEPNVYDELDYSLAPDIEKQTEIKKVIKDQTVSKEIEEKEISLTVRLKKNAIIIGTLCVCGILVLIIGTAIGLKGKKSRNTFIEFICNNILLTMT